MYQFDGVLPDHANNKEVYKSVAEPLVYSALSGFNGILMCYGQTGTGQLLLSRFYHVKMIGLKLVLGIKKYIYLMKKTISMCSC